MGPEKKLITQTAEELLNASYPTRTEIIPGLIGVGVYILAGAPKAGKSFLALQLSMHVATGASLWGMPVNQGDVLYLALEDTFERLQQRYALVSNYTSSKNLIFCIKAPLLVNGLGDVIKEYCKNSNIKMIVIDTLQMIRSNNKKPSYSNDYNTLAYIRDLASLLNITILVVHHTRKLEADDKYAMISGTNGLLGSADGAFLLEKKIRHESEAMLYSTGRDYPDLKISLNFNKKSCTWYCNEVNINPWESPKDDFLEAIDSLLKKHGGQWVGTPTALYNELNNEEWPVNKLSIRLRIKKNELSEYYNIKYKYIHSDERKISLKYIDTNVGVNDD